MQEYPLSPITPAAVSMRLRVYIETHSHTQSSVAEALGIAQSQVSRILHGEPKRISNNMRKMCAWAGIDWEAKHPDPRSCAVLMDALSVVWGGTEEQARTLAGVLESLAIHTNAAFYEKQAAKP